MIHVKARNDDDEFINIIFRFASVLYFKLKYKTLHTTGTQ